MRANASSASPASVTWLDLDAANALVQLAHESGAGIAVTGDPRQALPVGHSGAMELIRRHSLDRVELQEVHRFVDPEWANLTLKIREARGVNIPEVAAELIRTGHVEMTSSTLEAERNMVDAWFHARAHRETISLVTATHAEAQAVGEAIQARRVQAGALSTQRTAAGQNGQTLLEGDVVQTRRNNTAVGVQNRQNWVISRIRDDGILLTSASDSTVARKISHEYAAEHLHLGYASTVYGAQGETTDHSLVGPGVDAAGLYVGLTRGRRTNNVILTTPTETAAKAELADMLQRGTTEATIAESRDAATLELRRAAVSQQQNASAVTAGSSTLQLDR